MNTATLEWVTDVYKDAQTGYVVNLDAEDKEISRWPLAVIPSMGLAVLLRNGRALCYAADCLADASPAPGVRLLPVPAKLAALLP